MFLLIQFQHVMHYSGFTTQSGEVIQAVTRDAAALCAWPDSQDTYQITYFKAVDSQWLIITNRPPSGRLENRLFHQFCLHKKYLINPFRNKKRF